MTGEQGYIDDERSCFWTWDDAERAFAVQTIQVPPGEDKKRKGKRKRQRTIQKDGRAFFGDEQAQDPEWWQEEDLVWWSKGKKGKKVLSKGNDGLQKGGASSPAS